MSRICFVQALFFGRHCCTEAKKCGEERGRRRGGKVVPEATSGEPTRERKRQKGKIFIAHKKTTLYFSAVCTC
jgi:hypothetical protein